MGKQLMNKFDWLKNEHKLLHPTIFVLIKSQTKQQSQRSSSPRSRQWQTDTEPLGLCFRTDYSLPRAMSNTILKSLRPRTAPYTWGGSKDFNALPQLLKRVQSSVVSHSSLITLLWKATGAFEGKQINAAARKCTTIDYCFSYNGYYWPCRGLGFADICSPYKPWWVQTWKASIPITTACHL